MKETKTSGLDVTIHVAAGISYNHKGPLIFYKDPKEPSEKTIQPRKPRKSKYESQDQWQQRVQEWEESQLKATIMPKGNAISQEFYAREILPKHIDEIRALEKRYKRPILFQEDGDPSHGIRSYNNPAARLKRNADLKILAHTAQSPDLNPIEAIWQIIKQRLRGGRWPTVAAFKEAIQAEWDRVTLVQIRRRIREMRWRCKKVQELNRARVRSQLW